MWISTRNQKRVPINYKAWITRNHTDITTHMFVETKLQGKDWVKKKTSDKSGDIINYYNDLRKTVDCTRWGIKEIYHKKPKT